MVAIRKMVATSLAVLYPYFVYRGIQSGVEWLAPAIVVVVLLAQVMRAKNVRVRSIKFVLVLMLLVGMIFFQTFTAKLIPTLIQLALMHFFGKTLLTGKGPTLIERFVSYEFSEIPLEIVRYCRQLTWIWTGFFAFNAIVCSALGLWGQTAWWAFYTGILIFVLTGLLMVGEYIYRHYRFPNLAIADFKSSVRSMIINSRQIWLDVQAS